jgi:hypothetical protein
LTLKERNGGECGDAGHNGGNEQQEAGAVAAAVAPGHFQDKRHRQGDRPENEPYRRLARVIRVDDFFKYYGNWDEEQLLLMSPDDLDARTAAGEDWRQGKRELTIRQIPDTKPAYLIAEWVFHLEQWHAICPAGQDYYLNSAPLLADYLGLPSRYDNEELACLIYPDKFDEPTYQPCAVNQYNWERDHLFMSYPNRDNFGRTRNRRGDQKATRIKEQIHFVAQKPEYEFKTRYLGQNNDEQIVWYNIVQECLNRFDEDL